MRGRKRQRKKNEKRRGVWGLLVSATPKRGERDQAAADALAILMDYKLRALERNPLVGWHPEWFGIGDDAVIGTETTVMLPLVPLDIQKKLGR